MSCYSGKCDLWDSLVMINGMTDESNWDTIKIYHKDELLDISSLKDLIPYAAYLVSYGCWSQDMGELHLTEKSFVDMEEEDSIHIKLEDMLREYKKCKKMNTEFVPETAAEKYKCFYAYPVYLEIAKRVKENPKKPNLEGIHTPLANMYREALYDAMLKYGWDKEYTQKWVYGI